MAPWGDGALNKAEQVVPDTPPRPSAGRNGCLHQRGCGRLQAGSISTMVLVVRGETHGTIVSGRVFQSRGRSSAANTLISQPSSVSCFQAHQLGAGLKQGAHSQ